jgi:heme-degrading monooxygenase HmoA
MHASIGHYVGPPDAASEIIQAARQLASALSHAPGFVSYALLDLGEGALASISVFESRPELDDGERLIDTWMAEHLAGWSGPPAAPEVGEIVVQRGM